MKILVVQDHLRSGGTERQSVLLAAGFAGAGHEVTLLTFRPGGALASSVPASVRLVALQSRDVGLDWWAPRLVATARRLSPDVVLCMGRLANCYGASLQRALPRAAVVATLRTGKPLPWLFRRSLRQVRHVVANSEAARRAAALADERVTVIRNALVFPPAGAHRDLTPRHAHGASAETIVLLCVAMFRPEKNQRALIDIVRDLPSDPDWQLWLAGNGPELRACSSLVATHGLARRVRFLGWIADPAPLYRAADVAVLTSRRESLSNFLIEAQAHGLPAVAYDARGVTETLVPGESGMVVPTGDPVRFRGALLELMRDPARRAAMGTAARQHARREFAPERQVQAHLDLFSRLVTRSLP